MEYDLIVRNGYVVDGTGLPRRRVDIAVKDGRIARIGRMTGVTAREEIDAKGRIVAPGIVDAHTHYDPQITFDPYATMSCFHGVTTVLAGNCGFSAAPVKAQDREFIKGIFAKVEDMDPIALSGVAWEEYESFEEFLNHIRSDLGINFACYVGHSNVRRWVMGDACVEREATPEEIERMAEIVEEAVRAGAAGFSSSSLGTQNDIKGRPVPSRFASHEEILALAEAAGRAGTGTICYLPAATVSGMKEEDNEFITEIDRRSGLPVIIQGLGAMSKTDVPGDAWDAAVVALDRATQEGAPFYSMLIARPFDRPVRFDATNKHWQAVASWDAMTRMSLDERRALLKDPKAREEMRHAVENQNTDPTKGTILPAPKWHVVFIQDSPTIAFEEHQGRSISELAEEKGVAPGDFALDLALADDFETALRWRMDGPEWSNAVLKSQKDPRMLIGTSDGGAHLAKDDQSDWSSYFLGTWVRERKVWSLEEGIRQITQMPASVLGFHDRGTLQVGNWADMMIFDADEIGTLRKEFVHDLPGGVGRYKAYGKGIYATIVNGQPIVLDGELTGRKPGMVVTPS